MGLPGRHWRGRATDRGDLIGGGDLGTDGGELIRDGDLIGGDDGLIWVGHLATFGCMTHPDAWLTHS
jgi:hypothetical protein